MLMCLVLLRLTLLCLVVLWLMFVLVPLVLLPLVLLLPVLLLLVLLLLVLLLFVSPLRLFLTNLLLMFLFLTNLLPRFAIAGCDVAVFLLCFSLAGGEQGGGKTRSLLIGINYVGQQGELAGCHNDVKMMKAYIATHVSCRIDVALSFSLSTTHPISYLRPTFFFFLTTSAVSETS